jgi:hypothetical protein
MGAPVLTAIWSVLPSPTILSEAHTSTALPTA